MTAPATDVFVATSDGLVDGRGRPRRPTGAPVEALVAVGNDLWAVVDGEQITRIGADEVSQVAYAPNGLNLTAFTMFDDALVVGTEPAHLYRLRPPEERSARPVEDVLTRIEDFDEVPGRETWTTPWGGPPAVRSMARDGGGTLYVNVHVGGIVRHDASGWAPTIAVEADVHDVAVAADGTVLAATARGLALSRDRGGTWDYATNGLHGQYCRAVAIAGDDVLVSASTGPGTTRGALYRTCVDEDAFVRVRGGLPQWFSGNVDTGCVAVRGEHIALGGPDGAVYVSGDYGRSWERTASGLATVHAVAWSP